MTSQFDFTNAEWSDIAALPVLLGYAVAQAEDSGRVGTFRELRALVNRIGDAAPQNAAQALIEAASTIDVRDKLEEFEDHTPELLGDVAVTACDTIARVVEERAEADEAQAFKQWVYDIAHQVASTAKEDGVRISAPESALLDRAKAALSL